MALAGTSGAGYPRDNAAWQPKHGDPCAGNVESLRSSARAGS